MAPPSVIGCDIVAIWFEVLYYGAPANGRLRSKWMKNPRRVAAGKVAYGIKKSAQDEADKPVLQFIGVVVVLVTLIGLFAFGGK